MEDGLYQVVTNSFCAGFVIKDGKVTECAPILRKRIEYWKTVANLIEKGNKSMQIQILSVTVEHMPGKNGGYDKAEVAYKDHEGKVAGKNVVSFNAPEAFDVLRSAKNGDVLEVTPEKDAKGYWQWVKIVKVDASAPAAKAAPAANGAVATPKNTYETAEERAQKQLLIVRQSSLNAAIATLAPATNAEFNVEDVLNLARTYEKFVYSPAPEAKANFADGFKGDEKDVIQ